MTTDLLTTARVESFRNVSNIDRFTFLCDEEVVMNYHTMTINTDVMPIQFQSAHVIKRWTFFKDVDIIVRYKGPLGGVGFTSKNVIGMFAITENSQISLHGDAVVKWVDWNSGNAVQKVGKRSKKSKILTK